MSGYWIDDPANPFNQMSYTRGGGGYDNSSTRESNERRADAMQGSGAGALPRFATPGIAQASLAPGSLAVVGENVVRTRKAQPGTAGAGAGVAGATTGGGGRGAGSQLVIGGAGGSGPLLDGVPWPQDPKKGPAVSYYGHDGLIPMNEPRDQEGRQFPFLSIPWEMNPYVPNAETIEDEWGDADFLSPGWFVLWSTVPAHLSWNVDRFGDHIARKAGEGVKAVVDGYKSWPIGGPEDVWDPTAIKPMSAW